MLRPTLKQFADLRASDFVEHPVWIGCTPADYDEPWYDDADEETFRPREGPLPAEPSEGILLLSAMARLNDGATLPAFLTPTSTGHDLGAQQPHVFVGEAIYGFWGGIIGTREAERRAFFADLRKRADDVFPMHVAADEGLCLGTTECIVPGWVGSKGRLERRRRWWWSRIAE